MSSAGRGRITRGLVPDTAARKTLAFVTTQLPNWRDDPDRPDVAGEEELNGQLCKYLNVAARREDFSMAYFHHEERQAGQRRVDLSALPLESAVIEGRAYTKYEPFLVLEGKRLPAPAKNREREYVTGGEKKSGGIQRFKLGLHGALLNHAGMIGYVQSGTLSDWHKSINEWIGELSKSARQWTSEDSLCDLLVNAEDRIATSTSHHSRIQAGTDAIELSHLWIDMV